METKDAINTKEFVRIIIINNDSEREYVLRRWRMDNRKRLYKVDTDITSSWLKQLWYSTTHCIYCGVKMSNNGVFPNGRSLDHILPLSKGGKHRMNNVRYICARCNGNKRDMLEEEFLQKFKMKGNYGLE